MSEMALSGVQESSMNRCTFRYTAKLEVTRPGSDFNLPGSAPSMCDLGD